jgi:5-methylcytosine-specific restriction endonuclease McrA
MRRKKIRKKTKVRRKKPSQRNMRSKQYSNWRTTIYKRDGYACRICGSTERRLNAHHIKPWSLFPLDRYKIINGITLCVKCHEWVHEPGRKSQYLDLGYDASS